MTAKPSSVRATSAVSPSRYVGKVCDKHPELGGLRLIRNYTCVGCMRDQKRKSRATTGLSPEQRREAKVRYVCEMIASRLGDAGDWTPHIDLASDVIDYVSRGTLTPL